MKTKKMNRFMAWMIMSVMVFCLGMPVQVANAESNASAVSESSVSVSDVQSHWANKQISEWIDKGLAKGYPDGTFRPNNNITRAEFVALVNKAFKFTETASIDFTDVSYNDWFYNEIAKAKKAGYISGYADGTVKPNNPISRQEAAVIVAKIKNLEQTTTLVDNFSDAYAIPSWSKEFIGAIVEADYMHGYPDGSFRPTKNISRAEAVVTLNNAMGEVTEEKKEEEAKKVTIKEISKQSVRVNQTTNIAVKVEPTDAKITAKSSDEKIAKVKVDKDILKVEGIKEGEAKITVTAEKDGYESAEETFTIDVDKQSSGGGGGGGSSTPSTKEIPLNDSSIDPFTNGVTLNYANYTIDGDDAVAKTYGPATGTATINGNVRIDKDKVTLRNLKINGTLTLDPGATGTVNISDVEATNIEVLSGADHSINFANVKVTAKLEVKTGVQSAPVRIHTTGTTNIAQTVVSSAVQLDQEAGSLGNVEIQQAVKVELKGTFKPEQKITANKENAEIDALAGVTGVNVVAKAKVTVKAETGAAIANVSVETTSDVTIDGNGSFGTIEVKQKAKVAVKAKTVAAVNVTTQEAQGADLQVSDTTTVAKVTVTVTVKIENEGKITTVEVKTEVEITIDGNKPSEVTGDGKDKVKEINTIALKKAIETAQDKVDTAKVGNESGNYPQEAVDALKAAITVAQAVVDKENVTQAEIDNAVTTLNSAIKTFDASEIKDVTPKKYTVTFAVYNDNNSSIDGAKISVNSQNLTTDSNGSVTVSLENGSYPYTVEKSGYNNKSGNVTVNGAALTETDTMKATPTPPTKYTVTFAVYNDSNSPIDGAKISVNSQNLTTDSKGSATVSLENGSHSYTVEKSGYTNKTGSVTVNGAALTETVNMTTTPTPPTKYTVTFAVYNNSNSPIDGAKISVNSQNLTTDSKGSATISLENETYGYTVTKSGYTNKTGNVTVNGAALTEKVTMTATSTGETVLGAVYGTNDLNNLGTPITKGAAEPTTAYTLNADYLVVTFSADVTGETFKIDRTVTNAVYGVPTVANAVYVSKDAFDIEETDILTIKDNTSVSIEVYRKK
ncbi:MAG: S-layer homology domain-containing protein [Marinisporobacter sp.]|jgi:hypothetical protein|nr:S-layer homology domain-containing protein [Marinisporobacter sp.]